MNCVKKGFPFFGGHNKIMGHGFLRGMKKETLLKFLFHFSLAFRSSSTYR